MRAIVPSHMDEAIVRAAYVAREVVTKVVELTSAVLAMWCELELEFLTSSISAGDQVEQLRLVVAVPASLGRQEAHHPYGVVVNLVVLWRNLPWNLFRHGYISGKRIKAPTSTDVITPSTSPERSTL